MNKLGISTQACAAAVAAVAAAPASGSAAAAVVWASWLAPWAEEVAWKQRGRRTQRLNSSRHLLFEEAEAEEVQWLAEEGTATGTPPPPPLPRRPRWGTQTPLYSSPEN